MLLNAKYWIDQVLAQTQGRDDGASFIRSLGILKEARITTARLTLRELSLKDLQAARDMMRESGDSFFLSLPDRRASQIEAVERALLSTAEDKEDGGRSIYFAVYEKESNKFIGFVSMGFNTKDQVYRMPYMIAKEEQNKGYGSEALSGLVDVYRKLSSNQIPIQVRVQSTNAASRRVFEKLGFQYQSEIPSRFDEGYQVPPISVYELRE